MDNKIDELLYDIGSETPKVNPYLGNIKLSKLIRCKTGTFNTLNKESLTECVKDNKRKDYKQSRCSLDRIVVASPYGRA